MRRLKSFDMFKINEGLIKSYDPDFVISKINSKHGNIAWHKENNDHWGVIKVGVIPNKQGIYNDLIREMENSYGWVLSGMESTLDPWEPMISDIDDIKSSLEYLDEMAEGLEKDKPIYDLVFEAKYNLVDEKMPDYVYHVTSTSHLDKIQKMGLAPKSKAKLTSHPGRIYLLKAKDRANDLVKHPDFFFETGRPVLLKIDISEFKKSHKFYKDPNLTDGGGAIYTTDNIPPNLITVLDDDISY